MTILRFTFVRERKWMKSVERNNISHPVSPVVLRTIKTMQHHSMVNGQPAQQNTIR
jgi:hypothetical protein